MSSVASLELCKELYELIGWGGNDRWKARSTTFQSIANAMAEQWGK